MTLRANGRDFHLSPVYDEGSEELTIVFHHGGRFFHRPRARYIGGEQHIYDHVDVDELSLLYMDELTMSSGIYGCKKYYTLGVNGFEHVGTDRALYKLCKECLSLRVVHLYVDAHLERQVGSSNAMVDNENNLDTETDDENEEAVDENVRDDQAGRDDDVRDDQAGRDDEVRDDQDEGIRGDGVCMSEGDATDEGSVDLACTESELRSLQGSDDEDTTSTLGVAFNSKRDLEDEDMVCGKLFKDLDQFKEAIRSYSNKRGRPICINKSEKTRCSAKCKNSGCGWFVNVSLNKEVGKFEIRKLNGKHKCSKSYRNCNVKSGWIAKRYMSDFVNEPNPNIKNFRNKLIRDLNCHISRDQVYRAKGRALDLIRGSQEKEYSLIWDYIHEIKRTDTGASLLLKTSIATNANVAERDGDEMLREFNIPLVIDSPRFQRLYCTLSATKTGQVRGNRKIFGLDGCHFIGKFSGMLLTAVSMDPNNNLFPIAHAAVESETKDSWIWFLDQLRIDLGIAEAGEWTIISDKQKGLIQACEEVFPMAAHRFCVRHLHDNFVKAGFPGEKLKDVLYRAAMATTVVDFKHAMKSLKDINSDAAAWLEDKPPEQWSKSHFSFISKCDIVLNNVCESYNSRLVDAREMPVLSMFEWIRKYLMKKFQEARERAETKWQGKKICPKVMAKLHKNIEESCDSIPCRADVGVYECNLPNGLQFCVNINERSCTCRKWGLTGIPCSHACAALAVENKDPEDYVDECYYVSTYMSVYRLPIQPIVGLKQLPDMGMQTILPPLAKRRPGKPKKLRKKSQGEVLSQMQNVKKKKGVQKLSRSGLIGTCSQCKKKGHNKHTCKEITETHQSVNNNGVGEDAAAAVIHQRSKPVASGTLKKTNDSKAKRLRKSNESINIPSSQHDAASISPSNVAAEVASTEQGSQTLKRSKLQVAPSKKRLKKTHDIDQSVGANGPEPNVNLTAGANVNLTAGANGPEPVLIESPTRPNKSPSKSPTVVSPLRRVTRSLSATVVDENTLKDTHGSSSGKVTSSLPSPNNVPVAWPFYRTSQDNPKPVPNFWVRDDRIWLPRSLIKDALEFHKKNEASSK